MKTWDLITIFTRIPRQPHEKHCICIDPERREVFFINTEPPFGRKAKALAVTIANHECHGLSKPVSYVDTTDAIPIPEEEWDAAVGNTDKHKGPLPPFLIDRLRTAISQHGQLTKHQRRLLGMSEPQGDDETKEP